MQIRRVSKVTNKLPIVGARSYALFLFNYSQVSLFKK